MQLTPALGFIDILRGAGEGGIVSYSKDLQYNFDLLLTPGVFVLYLYMIKRLSSGPYNS